MTPVECGRRSRVREWRSRKCIEAGDNLSNLGSAEDDVEGLSNIRGTSEWNV